MGAARQRQASRRATLADAVVQQLARAGEGNYNTPELQCVRPLLELQQRWSALPTPQRLLAEVLKTREGSDLFLYPFAGRHVHLGLANLIAWRVAQHAPRTFSIAVNDYGFELLSATEVDWPALLLEVLTPGNQPHGEHETPSAQAGAADEALACTEPVKGPGRRRSGPPRGHPSIPQGDRGGGGERGGKLLHEVLASLNASELAQRRFREIARVAGLIFQGYPDEKRSSKQLQASSSLFYEVFRKYDPANQLLLQAEQELLAQELEIGRLHASLARIATQQLVMKTLLRPTPFSFPLMVERFREKLSNESVADRIARMVEQLEKAAGGSVMVGDAERVKGSLAFGQEGPTDRSNAGSQRPRRERKPSRPLPLL